MRAAKRTKAQCFTRAMLTLSAGVVGALVDPTAGT
jgi:hypothetical protein